jgi:hypothetical protein
MIYVFYSLYVYSRIMNHVLSKFYFIFKALYVIAILHMNDLNLISLDLQVFLRETMGAL